MNINKKLSLLMLLSSVSGITGSEERKASSVTCQANESFKKTLPPDNQEELQDVTRGFIASLANPVIKDENGSTVWDLEQYRFLQGTTPATVNPSLWQQAQRNMHHGLFKVTDNVYQIRGFDLSNMSIIEGDTGWIVIDPLAAVETARAGIELARKHLGNKPIVAVIYTHSHVDHFGGVKGVISQDDVATKKVPVLAPEGFLQEAISENIFAGNVMTRRVSYMYGSLLPKGIKGQVDCGLGKGVSSGFTTLIPPTATISKTGTTMHIDGIEIIFQNTPGAEAPAEMMLYFPQLKALCAAELATATMHNLYTLRGAKVRDAKAWAAYLDEALDLFGKNLEVVFSSHNWPRWGNDRSIEYLKKQRDLYKYMHDQTLRLANHGYTMTEIAEMITLPESLAKEWFNRGYYGSLNHNVKAIYQRYLGWFDGNPAHLHQLPPTEAGKKYVEFMGGSKKILKKAKKSYASGEYRWVAEVLNHVIFAEPDNKAARQLQADALEQLGYQTENGPWRNFYLTGAQELREGVVKGPTTRMSDDIIHEMTPELFFDYLAVKLNGPKAVGKKIHLMLKLIDTNELYQILLENAVLHYKKIKEPLPVDATIALQHADLSKVMLADAKQFMDEVNAGTITIEGATKAVAECIELFDRFDFWFNIVTP